MSISKDQWAAIGRIVLVALVALAAVFGYDLGVVQPREALQRAAYGSQATSRFTSDVWLQNSGLRVDKTLAVTGASTLSGGVTGAVTGDVVGNVTGNVTSTGANSFGTASATYITSTNVISMSGATFTGPLKYGTVATYTSGLAITHGFVSTPTACLMFPGRDVTETLTLVATTFSSDRASQTSPVYWACGK